MTKRISAERALELDQVVQDIEGLVTDLCDVHVSLGDPNVKGSDRVECSEQLREHVVELAGLVNQLMGELAAGVPA
jgi:hypothetical protein